MFGLYIHWPFCLSKCVYCDFGSKVLSKEQVSDDVFQKKYCDCCKRQMQYFSKKMQHNEYQKELSSVYFGGGTPSLLRPENVSDLLTEANNLFNLSKDCEVTLEANPTSFELEKFSCFREVGVNRLSLGVQSFDNNELLWLGRKHSAEQAIAAIEKIKKIFSYWSFDLIYGLPNQSIDKWLGELKQAIFLEPKHLSLYTLIVDDNTPLGKMVKIGNIVSKTDDEMADFYDATNDFIKNVNFAINEERNRNCNYENKIYSYKNKAKSFYFKHLEQYEVSNYAVSGFECKHNCCYWGSDDYIGVGAMAHGRLRYFDGKRYETLCVKDVKSWFSNIEKGKNGLHIERALTKKEQVEEIFLMGLRTRFGVDINNVSKKFGFDVMKFLNQNEVNVLKKNGFLLFDGRILKLTNKGLKILDTILEKILA